MWAYERKSCERAGQSLVNADSQPAPDLELEDTDLSAGAFHAH